jgi:hypothetical protein
MAERHKLTLGQQLKGVRKALESKKTPTELRKSLRKRVETLRLLIAKKAEEAGFAHRKATGHRVKAGGMQVSCLDCPFQFEIR